MREIRERESSIKVIFQTELRNLSLLRCKVTSAVAKYIIRNFDNDSIVPLYPKPLEINPFSICSDRNGYRDKQKITLEIVAAEIAVAPVRACAFER